MKRNSLLFGLVLLSYFSYSQDTVKIKELGFTTANLSDFGITYRQGDNKSVWRFNAITGGVAFSKVLTDTDEISDSGFSIGLQAGKEWRKILNPKFELRFGADIGLGYHTAAYESFDINSQTLDYTTDIKSLSPSIIAVLGFNFVFADNFLVGTEFQPAISYSKSSIEYYRASTQETTFRDSESFGFGFSTDAIRLSLLYRF